MRTAYVIHAPRDRDFVEGLLIPPLPSLGVDHWVSARHLAQRDRAEADRGWAMAASTVIIAVLSQAAGEVRELAEDIEVALRGPRPVIVVRVGQADLAAFGTKMAALPRIELPDAASAAVKDRLRRELGDLLPAEGEPVGDDQSARSNWPTSITP